MFYRRHVAPPFAVWRVSLVPVPAAPSNPARF
jgi:hypothetical protein